MNHRFIINKDQAVKWLIGLKYKMTSRKENKETLRINVI
jgi:hypothetical protein